MQNKNFKKLREVLDSSSEAFMLIALVGLFAMPFVIGSNLVAVTPDNSSSSVAYIYKKDDEINTQEGDTTAGNTDTSSDSVALNQEDNSDFQLPGISNNSSSNLNESVLGEFDDNSDNINSATEVKTNTDLNPFNVVAERYNQLSNGFVVKTVDDTLSFFDYSNFSGSDIEKILKLRANQSFSKTAILKLSNDGYEVKSIKFGLKEMSSSLDLGNYIDSREVIMYVDDIEFNSDELPEYINLKPGESVIISLSNNSETLSVGVVIEAIKN